MDHPYVRLMQVGAGLLVFIGLLRWAWGPLPWGQSPSRNPMNSAFWNLHSDPEKPWVARARRALARMPPPPRLSGQLEGWSWRPVERDPSMTVHVDEHSLDGRRISGHITGTPGVLDVACNLRTDLMLVDGWITLTPEGSPPMTLRKGDSLVLHPGFRGQWQNETVAHLNFEVTRS